MPISTNAKRIIITFSVLTILIGSLLVAIIPMFVERWLNQFDLQSAFHEATGGSIATGVIELRVFPTPHLIITAGKLDVPDRVSGAWQEIRIHPALLSLLSGRVQFQKISIIDPDVRLDTRLTSEKEAPATVAGGPLTADYLHRLLRETSGYMAIGMQWLMTHAPQAGVRIHGGRLQLVDNRMSPSFFFDDIEAQLTLPPDALQIELDCKSSLLQNLRVVAAVEASTLTGHVTLWFDNLDSGRLAVLVGLDRRLDHLDGMLSGHLRLNFKDSSTIESHLSFRLPELALQRLETPVRLRNVDVDGVVSIDETGFKFNLDRLNVDAPRLRLTGHLQAGGEVSGLRIHLVGSGIDIAQARQATLQLVGDSEAAVDIFNVLRAGHVPWISWRTEGPSLAALGVFRNMKLTGEVQSGQLFIPGADLELTDVDGIADIAEGVLRGESLTARHLSTRGRNGKLWIDFAHEDDPLFLEIDTHMQDVGLLPLLLVQWVDDAPFQEEMQRLSQVHGEARGIMILDSRNGRGLEVTADVAQCRLSAQYDRLPWEVQIEKGQVQYTGDRIAVDRMRGIVGPSRFSGLKAHVAFGGEARLQIDSARLGIDFDALVPWLASLGPLKAIARRYRIAGGSAAIDSLRLKGPFLAPSRWEYHIKGRVDRWKVATDELPDVLHFSNFVFETDEKSLRVRRTGLKALDADLTGNGRTVFQDGRLRSFGVQFKGSLGQRADKWINDLFAKDDDFLLTQTPMDIATATIDWTAGAPFRLTADLTTSKGVRVSLSQEWQAEVFRKDRIQIRDGEIQAILSTDWRSDQVALAFEGTLTSKTLDRLLLNNPFPSGRLKGDFQAAIVPAQPARSSAEGYLTATNIPVPLKMGPPIHLSRLQLTAEDNRLQIAPSAFLVDGNWHTLEGDIELAADRYHVDLQHEGAYFEMALSDEPQTEAAHARYEPYLKLPVDGRIRSRLSLFKWGERRWVPLKTTTTLAPGQWAIQFEEAELCGIQTTGTVVLKPQKVNVDLRHAAHHKSLNASLSCLVGKPDLIDGRFDLEGRLAGEAPLEMLGRSLDGHVKFKAEDGRIHRFDLLGRILATINLTELVRGKGSDLMGEGLAYRQIDIEAQLENNALTLDKALIDGASAEIAASGSLDLDADEIDMVVLVAPLKTVDALVKFTPIVNTWLEGTLVSIPVRVSGKIDDPDIVPMSPTAVGSSLINLLKNTVQLPIKLIEPLFDNDENDDEASP